MKVVVHLDNFSEKEIEAGKEEFAEKYPNDDGVGTTAEFTLDDFESEYVGDGDIYLSGETAVDVRRDSSIYVGITINIQELLEDESFWDAIESYVEKVEEEERRYNFMKALLKARKELEG